MAKRSKTKASKPKPNRKARLLRLPLTIVKSRITQIALAACVLIVLVAFGVAKNYQRNHADDPVRLGMSFSGKYARDLGLDEQETLDRLIDTGFRDFRLMSYWNDIEPVRNTYDWGWLDQQVDAIEAAEGTIILALGMRQPRFPECHIPEWANPEDPDQDELLEFIELVVDRYKDRDVIRAWQLENEASNRLFGECPPFDRDLFDREFSLVEQLDADRELLTNASNTVGWPWRGPVGDQIGFSYYHHFHYQGVSTSYWWVPTWWHSLRAQLVEWRHGSPAYIHELQAEPWGPGWIGDLSLEQQDTFFSADQLEPTVERALSTGMKEAYLWGGEFWVWRAERGDDTYLEESAKLLDQ